MRSWAVQRRTRRVVRLAILLLLGLAPAAPSRGENDSGMAGSPLDARLRSILLGERRPVLVCPACPGEVPLRIDPVTGQATEVLLPYESVDDIAPFADGKRLLVSTSLEGGKRSQLLVLAVESLAPTGRVEIPGRGEQLLVSRDGYRAYVLSRRPEGSHPEQADAGEWSLLVVDLGESRVSEKYPLSGPAFDLVLAEPEGRLFVSLANRIQSFTTEPLTASWQYRSPGENRCLAVRPGRGEVVAIRDDQIAVFPYPPGRRDGGDESRQRVDDAESVMTAPTHITRLGISLDGRIAVAAGRGLDQLVVLDLEARQVGGIWPQDESRVAGMVEAADAAARPRGPRGKLATRQTFGPPFGLPAPPVPAGDLSSPTDRTRTVVTSPVLATDSHSTAPPGAPPSAPPGPVPARPERKEITGTTVATPPSTPVARPEASPRSSLEEIANPVLAGRIGGKNHLVVEVLLFGPNSLFSVFGRAEPASDGTFSFDLPPKGRYRIVPVGAAGTTLASQPPYVTLEVGEFGFQGLDFRILGSLGESSPASGH